jgi:hypothetical protein
VVIELGAGLSTRCQRLMEEGYEAERWVDLDLEPVAALRRSLGAPGEQLAGSVLDLGWLDRIGEPDPEQLIFIAEGLFYYLPRAEVDTLLGVMAQRFPGAALLIDVLGRNDYPTLLEHTRAVGTPILWKLERDYAEVLPDLGLDPIPGFEPDRLMDEMLARYWHRFDKTLQGGIFVARQSPAFWAGRSGNVLGRLRPR